jgi:glutaredoxin
MCIDLGTLVMERQGHWSLPISATFMIIDYQAPSCPFSNSAPDCLMPVGYTAAPNDIRHASREAERQERKKEQNRIAQRNYRKCTQAERYIATL